MDVPECPGCRALLARIAEQDARILALEAQVRDLLDIIAKLKGQSPPPRAITPQPPAPAKTPTGKTRGGQRDHPPAMKTLQPPDRVTEFVHHIPERCAKCDAQLPKTATPNDPEPTRHQIAELPKILVEITEHQGHARTCPCCGEVTRATIPAAVRRLSFGEKFTAALSYLVGVLGMSKRNVETLVEDIIGLPIALGTIANREAEMSAALASAHEEARREVADAPDKNVDETGWKQAGKKRWLWVAATKRAVYFLIHPRRNLAALARLVGDKLRGTLGSDRWRVYDNWSLDHRQVCWAHLKRNWEKLVDHGGRGAKIGNACLQVHHRVFELWHLYRGGGCRREEFEERMLALSEELGETLLAGTRSRDGKLARFCGRVLDVYPAVWLFASADGIEPTNNRAERVLRRAVLWRRRSFGCASAAGCRFVERILTAVQTLREQGRSVLEFLTQTITAHRQGRPYSQLLPAAG